MFWTCSISNVDEFPVPSAGAEGMPPITEDDDDAIDGEIPNEPADDEVNDGNGRVFCADDGEPVVATAADDALAVAVPAGIDVGPLRDDDDEGGGAFTFTSREPRGGAI